LGKGLNSYDENVMRRILNRILNGKFSRPIVLLCGGLGTSVEAFERLGISRFAEDCLTTIGRSPEADARAVIRDWLVKDGKAQELGIEPWIEAISRETHGWPQPLWCTLREPQYS